MYLEEEITMRNKVVVRVRKKRHGMSSIFLEYCPPYEISPGKLIRYEFLDLEIYTEPCNEIEEKFNKEVLEIAEGVRCKRYLQIAHKTFNSINHNRLEGDFLAYFKENSLHYGVKFECSYNHFEKFCKGKCQFKDITVSFCESYKHYLLYTKNCHHVKKLCSNTASAYFKAFLSIVKLAYDDHYLLQDISKSVTTIAWNHNIYKEYLDDKEINRLMQTPFPRYPEMRRACLFSIYTGLRRIDVLNLQWENVHIHCKSKAFMHLTIQKTKTAVRLPLCAKAVEILGEPQKKGKVFPGVTPSIIRLHLPEWLADAKIDKHITFHCFRHTFAMQLLDKGVDIYTIATLLVHKQVTSTQTYAKIKMDQVRKALRILD